MYVQDFETNVKRQMLDKVRMNASAFPVLAQISGTFARNASDCVRDYLGTLTETVGSNFSVKRYGAFIDNTTMPAMIGVLKTDDDRGAAAISIEPRFANIITDLTMGGDMPDLDELQGRTPTAIDCALATILIDRLLVMFDQVMVGACGESIGLLHCERFEHVPMLLDIAPERSELISFQVAFEIGETGEPASFELLIPIAMFEKVRARLQYSTAPLTPEESTQWAAHMEAVVQVAPMPLNAELARLALRLDDVAQWSVGDVIALPAASVSDIRLVAKTPEGAQDVGGGRLGTSKNKKALKLDGPLDTEFLRSLG
ncbi:MAG: FliM/FliN family flagellar motor switch protein [Pseudomonadota bacterium]